MFDEKTGEVIENIEINTIFININLKSTTGGTLGRPDTLYKSFTNSSIKVKSIQLSSFLTKNDNKKIVIYTIFRLLTNMFNSLFICK